MKPRARGLTALMILGCLAACGEPRAVLLPLEYPDGSAVQSQTGQPIMAGYQTYGTAMHANATALYATAAPADCLSCARLGAVVSEPSALRQTVGLLGASTIGAGAVMGGLGMMNYGNAASDGKLGTNVTTNTSTNVSQVSSMRQDHGYSPPHNGYGWGNGGMGMW